jgi:hypothetical protein
MTDNWLGASEGSIIGSASTLFSDIAVSAEVTVLSLMSIKPHKLFLHMQHLTRFNHPSVICLSLLCLICHHHKMIKSARFQLSPEPNRTNQVGHRQPSLQVQTPKRLKVNASTTQQQSLSTNSIQSDPKSMLAAPNTNLQASANSKATQSQC